MAARQQGHMHGRPGLAAGAAGRPATREQLVGALLHASRKAARASADAKPSFAGHSPWRAGQQGHRIVRTCRVCFIVIRSG
jgi:hypothetical protein